jgi:hypothetical protein
LFYSLQKLLRFLVFGNSQYLTAFVMTAFGAYGVRETHLTAIATLGEVQVLESILRTTAIAAAFREFPFWKWTHYLAPA